MTTLSRLIPPAMAAAALAGCAGAPPPLPAAPVPAAQWSSDELAVVSGSVRLDWWRDLGSAELDGLVERALAANHEIAAAEANLRAARALAREAGRARGVSGGATAGVQRLREAAQAQPPIFITPDPFPDQTIANVGVDLAWEIDLAGGTAKNARAALAEAEAALWERRRTEAAIAAQVVRAWLDLTRAQALGDLLRQRIAASDRMLAISRSRIARGGALASDLAPLEQLRAALAGEAQMTDLAARNALRRIAVLAGEDPVALVEKTSTSSVRTLATPEMLTAHDPRTLLRLRPDVQAAEARLIAAFERAGASRAALYPSLSLGAGTGLFAAPGALNEAGALRFAIGPAINWGIFNLGQVRARIRAADAGSEAAAAQWQNSLLVALEEADGAIDLWRSARAARDQARVASQAAARATATIRARHRAGASGVFELAAAEADLLAVEAQLLSAAATQREAWAQAHLALGAGWRPGQ